MFLPTTIKEVRERGWDQLDVILFSGDAYIDHPAFGAAVVGRPESRVVDVGVAREEDHVQLIPSAFADLLDGRR